MRILIEDLTFETIIGILQHERTTPQSVRIDCTIDYPYAEGDFINYADVAALIESTLHREKFELIETALDSLASILKHHYPAIHTLILTLRKPDILPNCTVGVQKHFNF